MQLGWDKQLLLRPEDVPSSRDDWEVVGAFNPGATVVDGKVVLLVRVAERPSERRPGFVALPRWDPAAGPLVDWTPESELEAIDPRVVRVRQTGSVRLTSVSHLRVAWCGRGTAVERFGSVFAPAGTQETFGVEDPRISRIGDRYWFTYVAVSSHGAATALASTVDFCSFQRHGIIFPPENKDVVLFPQRVGGRYAALHRPNGATRFTSPEMWIAYSDDLIHWGAHRPLCLEQSEWRSGRVGAGCPPMPCGGGWLELYHGNQQPRFPGDVGRYVGGAMVLDGEDPACVRFAPPQPLLEPTEPFEREGFVPNVVFPTGIVARQGRVLLYYGAADCHTAVAAVDSNEFDKMVREMMA